jgi:DNA-binding NarL/FixJ family response regulator
MCLSMDEIANTIKVLAVDDHPLFLEGIAAVIATASDVQLVATVSSGEAALNSYRATRPDVTLMDLRLSDMNGIDAIGAIRQEFPTARIIVLTSHTGYGPAHRALNAGAAAYLLKDNAHRELVGVIRAVHQGRKEVDPLVARELAQHIADPPLTERELEVLTLVADGNTNRLAAQALGIQEDTVKGHVKSILTKLGARDRTHAVIVALRLGILSL